MEIFKLFGSVFIDNDKANKSLDETDKKGKSVGDRLGSMVGTAAKWGASIAAGAAIAVGGMVALGSKVGDMADAILDLNSITGMSTDSIQKWRKVTEVAGVAQDAMANASAKLTKSLDAMSEKSNKGNEALGKLGLSLTDIESMSADERMDVLTEALAGVEDKTKRAKLGTDLFGGSWKEIAPVVDLGAEAMQKAKDSANIISEEDLKKANDFRISVANMKDQVGFFVTEIGIKLLPMLQGMFDWIQGKMPLIQEIAGKAFELIGNAIITVSNFIRDEVIPIFNDMYAWISPHLPMIKDLFIESFGFIKDLLGQVREAIKFVIDNMNILLPVIIGVTAAVVAQMVIDGLIKLYKSWQTVTKTQTTLQWLLNAALNANPLGLIALAIGAVVTAGVLLWQNWDTVKVKATELWGKFKEVFGNIKSFVIGVWDSIWEKIDGVIGKIKKAVSAVTETVGKVVDAVTGGGGGSSNKSDPVAANKKANEKYAQYMTGYPGLATGGTVTSPGAVWVGENGPELLNLPTGAQVKPLDKLSSGVVFERGAFEGAFIMDDYGVDRLMDKVVERLERLGVKPT
jgi:hypothetical protein